MKELIFVTSNRGKIASLSGAFKNFKLKTKIKALNLDITEPQFDTVKEVSAFKAREAFKIVKAPLIVEDGGFVIDALNGFPGVYTKYVLKTIGVEGILKLMDGQNNRHADFKSCTSYVNEKGELFQFERQTGLQIEIGTKLIDIDSPYAWSELWKILYLPLFDKTMCRLDRDEVNYLYTQVRGSLQVFAEWFAQQSEVI